MCEKGAVAPDVSCTAGHHSTTIASHQFTIRLNTTSDYLCKLQVFEVRDVVLLCLFCCSICFSMHQYQLAPIYLSVRS